MTLRKLFIAAALLAAGPAFAEIGVVGAVNPDVEGTPPNEAARVLVTGDALFQNEEIVSGPNGLGYAMFEDQTTLTIAPNSRIVLDRYVYDPETGTGEIALSLARGAVRFIGGRISKTTDAMISTPTSTIGIRGGMAVISSGATDEVLFLAGEYASVSAGGDPLFISRAGGLVTVGADGPVYAGLAGADKVASLSGSFSTSGDGGAAAPDAAGEASSGVAAANSLAAGGVFAQPVSTTGLFAESAFAQDSSLDVTDTQDTSTTFQLTDRESLATILPNAGFVNVGGEGVVRGQVTWNDASDLDLHLILPNDEGEVFFGAPTIEFNNGGAIAALDADNLGGVINLGVDTRVENIVVSGENIPAGTYIFFVDAFSVNGVEESAFVLNATADGGATIQTLRGALAAGEDSANLPVIVGPGG